MNFFDALSNYDGIKLKGVEYVVKTKTLTANFLYNPTLFILSENESKVIDLLKSVVDKSIDVKTIFTKCSLDNTAISVYVFSIIVNNFPAISKDFSLEDIKVSIDGLSISINLFLQKKMFDYAVGTHREKEIKAKLDENFYGNFNVKFSVKEDFVGEEDAIKNNIEFQNSIKMLDDKTIYKLSNVQHIIGNAEYVIANDFSKIKDHLSESIVCGKITRIDKRTYKRKHTSNGETTEIDRVFFTLTIVNEGKFLNCSIFPKSSEEKRGEVLEIDRSVAMSGKFETYNGRQNFVAKTLCVCDIEKYQPPIKYKTVNENYHTVFPEEYQDFSQSTMFNANETIQNDDGKSYVVFDFETTGLDSKNNEIIEIGAVKIENGKIVSTFSSFIKPSVSIPKEITDLTSITNQMVENSPTINYVLPDFYKYCYNCGIVAHNIAFDYGFLSEIAKKMNYNFDNPQYDTLMLARTKLLGLKNFKLETVAEKLDVSLVGAHRAVNDAMATAKCFLKLNS